MLKPACKPTNISQFRGKTFAIDVYCFLHKGAFGCAELLVQGKPTDGYVKYVMKYVNLMLHYDIKPILVFDGRNLPSKEETEKKRRAARKENKEKAVKLLIEGRGREAKEYFQRCVDITPEMALDVIRAAREKNVDCIIAPYEADAQLAYLTMAGLADIVVTEDSDLTLFGCERILFKLIDTGDCVLYEREHLGKVFGLHADSFSFDKFRYMCITSGCDYLASLPGIGLGKAKNFWQKVTNPDLRNVLRKIPAYLKMPQIAVTQEYIERFIHANNTFLYQLVFDPQTRKERPVTPYPNSMEEEISNLTYCGSYSSPHVALQMALGNMNIYTKRMVDNYDPDNVDLSQNNVKTKYGPRATHRSVWCSDFLTKGPSLREEENAPKLGFAFQMSGTQSKPKVESQNIRNDVPKCKGVEKRKIDITDEQVEELLMDEETAKRQSPPKKKSRTADVEKFHKIVGLRPSVDNTSSNKPKISRFFAIKPTKKDSDDVEVSQTNVSVETNMTRGRRLSTGDSGTWFKDIEKPTSADGKFIYRPDMEPVTSSNILKEISNSPPNSLNDSEERRLMRNPFAVKNKAVDKYVMEVPVTQFDKGETEPMMEKSDSVSTIPSSQLSLYSIDGESLTFSSQDLTTDSPNLNSSNPSLRTQESSNLSQSPKIEPKSPTLTPVVPRLGLNRTQVTKSLHSPSVKNSQISVRSSQSQAFRPSKPSGLSRNSLKQAAGDGKKQTSILGMFARQTTKAQIGK